MALLRPQTLLDISNSICKSASTLSSLSTYKFLYTATTLRPHLPAQHLPNSRLAPSLRTFSTTFPRNTWTGTPRTMPLDKSEYLSNIFKDGIFKDKVVFCTGGNGSICSAQVRALVHLGANACIVGRNVEKTEGMAKDIATAREGSKVLGLGAVDVRSMESLEKAVETCVKELGRIDFCM